MTNYKDKVVVLTGVSHGIGLGYLKKFMSLECRIFCIDQNPLPIAVTNQVYFMQADLKHKETIHSFTQYIKQHVEQVDVIINNACINHKGLQSECSYHAFMEVLQVGVGAPYEIVNQLQHHLSHTSSIINMASTRAFMSQVDSESYTAAKGAMFAMTHAMSISLQGKARVNSIAPGWIDVLDYQASEMDAKQHSVKRIGKVEDIVELAIYLCSDVASFINGQNFVVDGGMSTQMIYHDDHGWTYQE